MTDEPAPKAPENDLPFTSMAARISSNTSAPFGGAFVVVPPPGGGEIIATLLLDSPSSPAQFWALLKTKAELALGALDMEDRKRRGFG